MYKGERKKTINGLKRIKTEEKLNKKKMPSNDTFQNI